MKYFLGVFVLVCLLGSASAQPTGSTPPAMGAAWKNDGTNLTIYLHGKKLEGFTSDYSDNDLLVYDSLADASVLLMGYKVIPPGELYRPAEILSSNTHAFWRSNGPNYWLYVKGKALGGLNSRFVYDDLFCTDPVSGITYILTNFKRYDDNTLRIALKKE